MPGAGRCAPMVEAMLTMHPPLWARIQAISAFIDSQAPVRLTFRLACQSASQRSATCPGNAARALLNAMSSPP